MAKEEKDKDKDEQLKMLHEQVGKNSYEIAKRNGTIQMMQQQIEPLAQQQNELMRQIAQLTGV